MKENYINLINIKKRLTKFNIQLQCFLILSKLGTEWNFLNQIKGICKKPTAYIKLNDKRLNTFRL